jgi:polysaccharide export outer membrane protein
MRVLRVLLASGLGMAIVQGYLLSIPVYARQGTDRASQPSAQKINGEVAVPSEYVIGPDDVLSIVFWREAEMSAQVRVRPDGRISLPLLNDLVAVGLTPERLRERLEQEAKRYVTNPNATVVVLEINSRRIFVVGQVAQPGVYPLNAPMNVLQAIASAGGLLEFAHGRNIIVERVVSDRKIRLPFDYREVVKGKKVDQNVLLAPGDTVIVP